MQVITINKKYDKTTGVTMNDCEVCGETYELILGGRAAAIPELKSGALFDREPQSKGGTIRFFCSTECGEKLRADILAA